MSEASVDRVCDWCGGLLSPRDPERPAGVAFCSAACGEAAAEEAQAQAAHQAAVDHDREPERWPAHRGPLPHSEPSVPVAALRGLLHQLDRWPERPTNVDDACDALSDLIACYAGEEPGAAASPEGHSDRFVQEPEAAGR